VTPCNFMQFSGAGDVKFASMDFDFIFPIFVSHISHHSRLAASLWSVA